MRFFYALFLTLFISFNAEAALQQSETHKGIALPDGYWGLNKLNIDVPAQAAYVTIALYANPEAYLADPNGNKLRDFDYGFSIGGSDYQEIFNQTHSVQEIVGDVWVYIKAYQTDPDIPPYFADAELVP